MEAFGLLRALRGNRFMPAARSMLIRRSMPVQHRAVAQSFSSAAWDKERHDQPGPSFAELFEQSNLARAGPTLNGRLVEATVLTADREVRN